MAFHADVVRFGIIGAAEAKDNVEEIGQPPHEERGHEPVDIQNQPINVRPMFRSQWRQTKKLNHIQVRVTVSCNSRADATASLFALFRARKMKNPATPANTLTTTPSKLNMPMFIPWANAESDLPKQAAQANANPGSNIIAKAAAAQTVLTRTRRLISN